MFYEELSSSLMIVGDHKYELIEHDGIEDNYYAVQRDDGYTFIVYTNEGGEWESDSAISPDIAEAIGSIIDENSL